MPPDLDRLQGNWTLAALEVNGASAHPGAAAISISGDQFHTTGMGAIYEGRFVFEKPSRISMQFTAGPEAGNTNHGIYEFTAAGWRLCLNTSGGPAPKAFRSSKHHALELFVRAEAAVPTPAIDTASRQPVPELQGEWAMVSCLRAGVALPPSFVKSGRRTVDGVSTALHFGTHLFMQGLLSRDGPDISAIRLEHTAGESAGRAQLGFFEIRGKLLHTCLGAPGAARPTRLESSVETGETYTVWKRR